MLANSARRTVPEACCVNQPFDEQPSATDSIQMAAATFALPAQLEAALASAQQVAVPLDGGRITNVVAMGMGGSGIAGDITAALAAPQMHIPVAVAKGYECPAYVGPGTLAIALSFSGNTEETLEAVATAHEAGASVVAVTSGGRLADLALEWEAPLYRVDGTIPMPRAAVGALGVAPLVALEQAGLLSGVSRWVSATVAQLRARQADTGTGDDADDVDRLVSSVGSGETVPVFYGGGALGGVAAGRAKAQVNENAKIPAFASNMPELCHNELAGWDQAGHHRDGSPLAVIALRHEFEHAQIRRRYGFTQRVFEGARIAVPYCELHAAGDGPMAQLFDLIYQVDVLSLRIAAAAGRDPGPVPLLTDLKTYLART